MLFLRKLENVPGTANCPEVTGGAVFADGKIPGPHPAGDLFHGGGDTIGLSEELFRLESGFAPGG
jgi:hypothetical protein